MNAKTLSLFPAKILTDQLTNTPQVSTYSFLLDSGWNDGHNTSPLGRRKCVLEGSGLVLPPLKLWGCVFQLSPRSKSSLYLISEESPTMADSSSIPPLHPLRSPLAMQLNLAYIGHKMIWKVSVTQGIPGQVRGHRLEEPVQGRTFALPQNDEKTNH